MAQYNNIPIEKILRSFKINQEKRAKKKKQRERGIARFRKYDPEKQNKILKRAKRKKHDRNSENQHSCDKHEHVHGLHCMGL